MIKCPCCGSAAQVRQVWSNNYNEYTESLVNEYSCGCGAHFVMRFKLTTVNTDLTSLLLDFRGKM